MGSPPERPYPSCMTASADRRRHKPPAELDQLEDLEEMFRVESRVLTLWPMAIKWHNAGGLDSQSYVCGYCGRHTGPNQGYFGQMMAQGGWHSVGWIYICTYCTQPTYFGIEGRQVPGTAFENAWAPSRRRSRRCTTRPEMRLPPQAYRRSALLLEDSYARCSRRGC